MGVCLAPLTAPPSDLGSTPAVSIGDVSLSEARSGLDHTGILDDDLCHAQGILCGVYGCFGLVVVPSPSDVRVTKPRRRQPARRRIEEDGSAPRQPLMPTCLAAKAKNSARQHGEARDVEHVQCGERAKDGARATAMKVATRPSGTMINAIAAPA